MPADGRDVALGFDNIDKFPTTFWGQVTAPFRSWMK
jgi:hypothetical protein